MINDHMKTNLNFSQTNLTSLEGLAKYIDPSQLTVDLEGSLAYDHSIWIEMRCVSVICDCITSKTSKAYCSICIHIILFNIVLRNCGLC